MTTWVHRLLSQKENRQGQLTFGQVGKCLEKTRTTMQKNGLSPDDVDIALYQEFNTSNRDHRDHREDRDRDDVMVFESQSVMVKSPNASSLLFFKKRTGRTGKGGVANPNQPLVKELQRLLAVEEKVFPKPPNQKFRLQAFRTAIASLQHYTIPITSYETAIQVPGIGDKIAKRIVEILQSGHLAEIDVIADDTEKALDDKTRAILDLEKYPGIGPSQAKAMVEKYQIMSYHDLHRRWKKDEIAVTHQIALGLKHHRDLQTKIPRKEIDRFQRFLAPHLDKMQITFEICGSYRRGVSESGDIDVLITHTTFFDQQNKDVSQALLLKVVELLQEHNYIVDNISLGPSKYMGLIRIPDSKRPTSRERSLVRHLDIRVISIPSWAAAKLYFTGPRDFNIRMRRQALKLGLTLNEVGLFPIVVEQKGKRGKPIISGPHIETATERDIFNCVNIDYLTPQERDEFR